MTFRPWNMAQSGPGRNTKWRPSDEKDICLLHTPRPLSDTPAYVLPLHSHERAYKTRERARGAGVRTRVRVDTCKSAGTPRNQHRFASAAAESGNPRTNSASAGR